MDKESASKFAQVIVDSARALKSVAAERDDLREKLAAYERREQAFKLAQAMHDKGLYREETIEDLTMRLDKEASADPRKLADIQRAIDGMAPQYGVKLASMSDIPSSGVDSKTAWEDYVING